MRIVITGWPGTGKTTTCAPEQAALAGVPADAVRHTDDLIGVMDWSDASAEVARWLDEPGPWVIEGVACARAIRKWFESHPGERLPIDRLVICRQPLKELSGRQAGMGRGVDTVLAEILPDLEEAGVEVVVWSPP